MVAPTRLAVTTVRSEFDAAMSPPFIDCVDRPGLLRAHLITRGDRPPDAHRLSFFFRGPIAFDAAARRSRLKVGHSMWLGARQAAAWRRPSRIALILRIVPSSS